MKIIFFIVTYNQEQYIKESILSVLNQSASDLKIVISDDCSIDRTQKIIKETLVDYQGDNEVIVNYNEKNLGIIGHLNFLIENFLDRDILIVQAGDDISYPHRAEEIKSIYSSNKSIYAVCSNSQMINQISSDQEKSFFKASLQSNIYNIQDFIAKGIPFMGAAASYRKEVFTKFGPLSETVRNEDNILPFRALLLGQVAYTQEKLLKYREHGHNLSFWVRQKSVDCKKYRGLEKQNIKNQLNNHLVFLQEAYSVEAEENIILAIVNRISRINNQLELVSRVINKRFSYFIRAIDKKGFLLLLSPCLLQKILNFRSNK